MLGNVVILNFCLLFKKPKTAFYMIMTFGFFLIISFGHFPQEPLTDLLLITYIVLITMLVLLAIIFFNIKKIGIEDNILNRNIMFLYMKQTLFLCLVFFLINLFGVPDFIVKDIIFFDTFIVNIISQFAPNFLLEFYLSRIGCLFIFIFFLLYAIFWEANSNYLLWF